MELEIQISSVQSVFPPLWVGRNRAFDFDSSKIEVKRTIASTKDSCSNNRRAKENGEGLWQPSYLLEEAWITRREMSHKKMSCKEASWIGKENESFQRPDEGCTQNNASLEINPLSTLSEAHLRTTAYRLLMISGSQTMCVVLAQFKNCYILQTVVKRKLITRHL